MRNFSYAAGLAGLAMLITVLALPSRSLAGYGYYPEGDRVEHLIAQLQFAWDDDDREDAAEELGKIGDPRAIPALQRAAARDGDKGVRKEALKAIRRIDEDCREENWVYGYRPVYIDAYYRPCPPRPLAYRGGRYRYYRPPGFRKRAHRHH
jgi:hypothetical protein